MNRVKAFLFLFAFLLAPAPVYGQEFIRITPEWVKDHPSRLEMSVGSAINGSNSYTFRLLSDERGRFSVLTQASKETEKETRRLLDQSVQHRELSSSVIFNATVWPEEKLSITFHIVEEQPIFKGEKITGYQPIHEYELHLSDFQHTKVKLPPVDYDANE